MPKPGDSPLPALYEELGRDGGSVIPAYLKPAMQKALEEMSNEVARKIFIGHPRGSGKTSASSFSGLAGIYRTPATGIVHKWDEGPFPYGTVIRPTAANENMDPSVRHMVFLTRPEVVVSLSLNGGEATGLWYTHLRENMHELWEEVPS